MKTTMPLHIDSADLARLKDHMPDLTEFEVPKLENVGRAADDTIDRLLGRSRPSVWPWLATGIGLIALVSVIAAAFMWMRRWAPEPEAPVIPEFDPVVDGTVDPMADGASNGYGEVRVPAVVDEV